MTVAVDLRKESGREVDEEEKDNEQRKHDRREEEKVRKLRETSKSRDDVDGTSGCEGIEVLKRRRDSGQPRRRDRRLSVEKSVGAQGVDRGQPVDEMTKDRAMDLNGRWLAGLPFTALVAPVRQIGAIEGNPWWAAASKELPKPHDKL